MDGWWGTRAQVGACLGVCVVSMGCPLPDGGGPCKIHSVPYGTIHLLSQYVHVHTLFCICQDVLSLPVNVVYAYWYQYHTNPEIVKPPSNNVGPCHNSQPLAVQRMITRKIILKKYTIFSPYLVYIVKYELHLLNGPWWSCLSTGPSPNTRPSYKTHQYYYMSPQTYPGRGPWRTLAHR